MDGSAAMKMIRSTRSTSIMGVTLISFDSPPLPPVAIDMLLSSSWRGDGWCAQRSWGSCLRLAVASNRRHGSRLLIADHSHHGHAVLHGDVHGVDDFRVVEVLVRLEIHDAVISRRLDIDVMQRGRDLLLRDRLLVQVIVAILVDAEDLVGLVILWMVLDVLRLWWVCV